MPNREACRTPFFPEVQEIVTRKHAAALWHYGHFTLPFLPSHRVRGSPERKESHAHDRGARRPFQLTGNDMHARVVTVQVRPGKTGGAVAISRDLVLPRLQEQPGWCEARLLTDDRTGRGLLVTL